MTKVKANYERILDEIQRTDFFDKHVIKQEGPTTWFCHIPGEGSIQSFWVTIQPGAIIMWGDMGEAIYTIYGGSPMVWGRRNFRFDAAYSYYPFTKLSHQMRQEVFSTKAATAYLEDAVKSLENTENHDAKELERAKKMVEDWEERRGNEQYEDEAEWWAMWAEHDDPDAPSMRELTPRTYWCYYCLCWFFAHVSADDPMFKDAYEIKT